MALAKGVIDGATDKDCADRATEETIVTGGRHLFPNSNPNVMRGLVQSGPSSMHIVMGAAIVTHAVH